MPQDAPTKGGDRPILWGRGSSTNVQKVIWTAAELGLEPDHRPLGGPFGGTDSAAFLAMNPNGTVPVWQSDLVTLYESQAIMRHLARVHGALYGAEEPQRAAVDCWLDWHATVMWPPVRTLFQQGVRDKTLPLDSPEALGLLARVQTLVTRAADRLADQPYLAGPDFTIADIAHVLAMNRLSGMALDITVSDPHRRWLDTQKLRPGFALATADEPDLPGHRAP